MKFNKPTKPGSTFIVLILSTTLVGCGDTISGLKKDSSDAFKNTQSATDNFNYQTKAAYLDLRDATMEQVYRVINQSASRISERAGAVASATE